MSVRAVYAAYDAGARDERRRLRAIVSAIRAVTSLKGAPRATKALDDALRAMRAPRKGGRRG